MPDTVYAQTTLVENSSSGVAWSAIFGGATAIIAVTMLLFPLGAALGFAGTQHGMPSASSDATMKGLTIASVIWLIMVQWISSGFGGYLTGRLRSKWHNAHTHEVFFRDTAHGFLSWGVATIALAFIIALLAGPAMAVDMHADAMHGIAAAHHGDTTAIAAPVMTEEDHKKMAEASLFLFLSMLIGAFIATTAAALGGRHRDVHYRHGRLVE